MQRAIFLMRALPLAAALVTAASCKTAPVAVAPPRPPADLFARADRPAATAETLTSDEAAERLDRDRDDWGKRNAVGLDAACRWMQRTFVYAPPLVCRQRPEWEATPQR